MRTSDAHTIEALFERYVERLIIDSVRLDAAELCCDQLHLLPAVKARIAHYEALEQRISLHRRLSPRQRIGVYEVIEEIGRGSMGFVYAARDTSTGRTVALKLFPPERANDAELVARFDREALALRVLDHPNIVKLYESHLHGDLRLLVMEFIEGDTLQKLLPEGGFTLPTWLRITVQLTDALAVAHERGIIHRDLKLSNLMLGHEEHLYVLDFGLAHFQSDDTLPSLTDTGRILGTVPALSPEQLNGEKVDARSDLFSLGTVFYELATGVKPFQGNTMLEIIEAILESQPLPPAEVGGELASGLDDLVMACLAKDREDRPRNARDCLRRLEEAARR